MAAAAALVLVGAGPLAGQSTGSDDAVADTAFVERSGRVVDSSTGDPIQGVRVSAASRLTHTDADGHFRIRAPEGPLHLHFRRPGYQGARVPAEELSEAVELEPAPFQLGALSIRTERRAELADGTALDVESVDGEEIHHHGGTTVAEGLQGVAGLSVERPGSWGSNAVLRGLGGERVAVMVDGSRVNRACVFGMDDGLATVDPSSVERVEVLQGPGSALYGSGNVGGVINVVTNSGPRDGDRWGEARLSASSAVPGGSVGGTAGARWRSAWVSASADLATYGDYRSGEGRVEGTSYGQGNAHLEVGLEPSPDHRVDLGGQVYEARDIGWPMHGEAEIPRESRRNLALDWAWQRGGLVDAISGRGYVQRVDHEMETRMEMDGEGHGHGHDPVGAGAPPSTSSAADAARHHEHDHSSEGIAVTAAEGRSYSTTSGMRLQTRVLPDSRFHLDTGLEVTNLAAEGTRLTETLEGPDGTPEHVEQRSWPAVSMTEMGVFGQGEWRVRDGFALTGGVRMEAVRRSADERPSVREWIPSGNVGLRAPLRGPLSLRSTLGWGYRTPDATELYGLALRPDGYVYRGNPEVETERGRNAEISLVMESGSLSATATAFQNDLSALIVPQPLHGEDISGLPVRQYENVDEARIRGLSASARWRSGAWAVDGTTGYVRGTDRVHATPLPEMPPLEVRLAARRDLGRSGAWIQAEGQGALRQDRVDEELGEPSTPGHAVVSLRGGFELAGTEVTLGAENLLDRAYRSHLDPPTLLRPGRNLSVRVTRSF